MAAKEDRPAAPRDLFASLLSEGKAVTDLRPSWLAQGKVRPESMWGKDIEGVSRNRKSERASLLANNRSAKIVRVDNV